MTRIKFCGLRRHEDIALANQFQPDFVGLIFAPSKRQIAPEQAAALVANLDPVIRPVGVFVNEPVDRIVAIAAQVGLAAVQLHGTEGPAEWAALRHQLAPGTEIWQKLAIPVDPVAATERFERFESILARLGPNEAQPDVVLLDTEVGGQSGGTGQTFPWQQLAAFARRHTVACAGGLNPDNVAAAIATLHPAIVDCSSGIERNLEKQADLMAAFRAAVQQQNSEDMNHDT
ncbi:MAG: phosphoribosylanthranilate isomerase [Clostridia bacterium]|nr:phosphoribosylanthranilate isomerase [Clostridia bacterium]